MNVEVELLKDRLRGLIERLQTVQSSQDKRRLRREITAIGEQLDALQRHQGQWRKRP